MNLLWPPTPGSKPRDTCQGFSTPLAQTHKYSELKSKGWRVSGNSKVKIPSVFALTVVCGEFSSKLVPQENFLPNQDHIKPTLASESILNLIFETRFKDRFSPNHQDTQWDNTKAFPSLLIAIHPTWYKDHNDQLMYRTFFKALVGLVDSQVR